MSSTTGRNIFPGITGDYSQDQKELIEASMRGVSKEISDHERCEDRLYRRNQKDIETVEVTFSPGDWSVEGAKAMLGGFIGDLAEQQAIDRSSRPTQAEREVVIVGDVDHEVVNALRKCANVGTIGHVNHGKTTLTAALIGALDKAMERQSDDLEFRIRNIAHAEKSEAYLLQQPPNPWSKRKKGKYRKYT
jgi:hypothetical protein